MPQVAPTDYELAQMETIPPEEPPLPDEEQTLIAPELPFPDKPMSPIILLNDWIQAESEKGHTHAQDHWYASDAGYCFRQLFYKRAGVAYVQKESARGLRIMSLGRMFHQWAQGVIQAATGEENAERRIELPEYNVTGRVDDIVKLAQGWTVVDFKSQHSDAFWRAMQKGDGMLKPHQRLQVGTYCLALQDEYPNIGAILIYISRDDLTVEQVAVPWTYDLERDVRQYWQQLNVYWEAQQVPPKVGPDQTWQCKWCPYSEGKGEQCALHEV